MRAFDAVPDALVVDEHHFVLGDLSDLDALHVLEQRVLLQLAKDLVDAHGSLRMLRVDGVGV